LTSKNEIENSTPRLTKVLGWFFYVVLLTKRKYECKQRQKEYPESQQFHQRNANSDFPVFFLLSLFHRHHPHSVKMEGQPTLQHDYSMPIIYHNFWHITTFFSIFQFALPITVLPLVYPTIER